jgi:hypothetical protein
VGTGVGVGDGTGVGGGTGDGPGVGAGGGVGAEPLTPQVQPSLDFWASLDDDLKHFPLLWKVNCWQELSSAHLAQQASKSTSLELL